ncbi:hypothetical protein SAMN05444581_1243 [Methylocapsa palsarum]|uniref:Uncharacterized protein n=2 Tax=Methylocapsa palsarum TaxID=1612308 RepID=A0A1I4CMU3_9HYPH|nr:hypothetical protein SAMN05444581_1243 [Methylocapsa palsarum]
MQPSKAVPEQSAAKPLPDPEARFNDPVARACWQILLATRFVLPAGMLYLAVRYYFYG